MTILDPATRPGQAGRDAANPSPLTASRLKITLTLSAAELAAVPAPDGKPRITLEEKQ